MAPSIPREDTTPLAVEGLLAVAAAVALEMHRTGLLPQTTPEERCCTTPLVPAGTFGPSWLHTRAAALTILRQCMFMVCEYTIAPPCGDSSKQWQGKDCFLALQSQLNGDLVLVGL